MTINVTEIFGPTIQGEGIVAGQKTSFLRLAYCDYRCTWCDSLHAVDPTLPNFVSKKMSEDEIISELDKLECQIVTISGGNPAMQNLDLLLDKLHEADYWVSLETQGSIPKSWMDKLDLVTLSPKPPSSGMKVDLDKLDACVRICTTGEYPICQIKVVVNIDHVGDMEFAKAMKARYENVPFYISCWTDVGKDTLESLMDRFRRTSEIVAADKEWQHAHVLPQLHVAMWGHKHGV